MPLVSDPDPFNDNRLYDIEDGDNPYDPDFCPSTTYCKIDEGLSFLIEDIRDPIAELYPNLFVTIVADECCYNPLEFGIDPGSEHITTRLLKKCDGENGFSVVDSGKGLWFHYDAPKQGCGVCCEYKVELLIWIQGTPVWLDVLATNIVRCCGETECD